MTTTEGDPSDVLDMVPAAAAREIPVGDQSVNFYEFGERAATPIIFLHGGGPGCTGWHDWAKVGMRYVDSHHLLFVDLPQFGSSSYRPIEGPTFTVYAGYLAGLLDALALPPAHFVCQSFGGSVALRLAIDEPQRFLSLAMTGSTPFFGGVTTPMPLRKVVRQLLGPYFGGEGPTPQKLRTLLADAEWFDEAAIPDALVNSRFEISTRPEALQLRTLPTPRGTPEDLDPLLVANTVPTLLAYGDADPFAPADIPLYLFTRFPEARLVFFKNAAHHFPEEQPDRYAAVLTGWLQEHEASAST